MNIGHSSRLPYDRCAYPDKLRQTTDPLSYQLNINQIHNCDRCFNANGAGPRATTNGYGNSTLKQVGYAPMEDLIDVDSIMSNRNVKTSKCVSGHVNPINLTTKRAYDASTCTNRGNPQFSRLSQPASNYRDISTNRFYNLLHDPQINIFYDDQHNTRLEAKDNWRPDLMKPFDASMTPTEYTGPRSKCGLTCN